MRTMILVAALVLAGTSSVAQEPAAQTFEGEYQWSQGGSDRLIAEFKPTGDQTWDVKFRFDFQGKSQAWKGTAKGSLMDGGSLTGTAESDGGRRTWAFEATVEDGVLSGTHTETTNGRNQDTGGFVLKR